MFEYSDGVYTIPAGYTIYEVYCEGNKITGYVSLMQSYNPLSYGSTCDIDGHKWIADSDVCQRCGLDFEDYKKGLETRFKWSNTKCTCGATAAGFDSHAHYCDLAIKKVGK